MTDVFSKIENRSAAEIVADEMEAIIIAGKYSAGEQLPTVRYFMRRFGRSYGTIRDALNILVEREVLTAAGSGGYVVHLIKDAGDDRSAPLADLNHLLRIRTVGIIDIVEYMTAAEPELAKWSAARCTWEDIVMMERQLEHAMSVIEDEPQYFTAVMELHYRIVQGAHNPLATMVWKTGTSFLKACAAVVKYDRSELHLIHREIIDAIRDHDEMRVYEAEKRCWVAYDTAFTGLLIYDRELGTSDSAAASGRVINRSSQKIYEQIRERILDGSIHPGDRLPPERSLSEAFGRSRPVVREALQRLAVEKYITIVPRSGAIVNETADDELREVIDHLIKYDVVSREDLIELRMVNESIAASFAASRRNDRDIHALRAVISRSYECINNRLRLIECGIMFNTLATAASHNGMARIVNRLTAAFMTNHLEYELDDEMMLQHYKIIEQHEDILSAITDGEADRASDAITEHLKAILSIMK